MHSIFRTGIGQDSHRFMDAISEKPCILGGLIFEGLPGFLANSDGDVIFHTLCNAISSLTGVTILGALADELCEKGITDGRVYLDAALKTLGAQKIVHVAITIEAKRPKILPRIPELKKSIAEALGIETNQVGITATSGEGLTGFGRGEGLQCFCVMTTVEEKSNFQLNRL